MACFLVPVGEAIVTTVAQKVIAKKEQKAGRTGSEIASGKWSQRLGWLNKMLWGGSFLLCLEHIWHGEIVPWWPFLTAMKNPEDARVMAHEIATYGVAMAVTITVIWAIMCVVAELRAKAQAKKPAAESGGA